MSEAPIFPAPVLELPSPPQAQWQRERHAFLQMLPQLLQTHRGQYVAVYQGSLVDTGPDKIVLALRVYERFGYVPIYVGLVADQPPVVRIPFRRPVPIATSS